MVLALCPVRKIKQQSRVAYVFGVSGFIVFSSSFSFFCVCGSVDSQLKCCWGLPLRIVVCWLCFGCPRHVFVLCARTSLSSTSPTSQVFQGLAPPSQSLFVLGFLFHLHVFPPRLWPSSSFCPCLQIPCSRSSLPLARSESQSLFFCLSLSPRQDNLAGFRVFLLTRVSVGTDAIMGEINCLKAGGLTRVIVNRYKGNLSGETHP